MNFSFYFCLLITHFLAISCVNNFDHYINVYSDNPSNINTPNYLIISKDGSYYKILRDGDDEHEYVSLLEEYGNWNLEQNNLNLFDAQTREKSEKFAIIPIGNNAFGLKPTLGEGRHSDRLYKPTKQREVLSRVYKKEGSYWEQVHVPFP